jgi:hypothetical protein
VDPRSRPDQHDTVVLNAQGTVAGPSPQIPDGLGDPAGAVPPRAPFPAPTPGWQAVRDWRDAALAQRSTAWSRLPPFIPSPQPPIVVMRNDAAVVGATLGSVSLFLSLLPLIGIVSWLLAPVGVLCSIAGLIVGMSRRVGRIGALWGLLTSGLALLVCLAWTALIFAL